MRHLHKSYHHAWCGEDASHIAMTHDPSEAECPVCIEEHASHHEGIAADIDANRQECEEATQRHEARKAEMTAKAVQRLEAMQRS